MEGIVNGQIRILTLAAGIIASSLFVEGTANDDLNVIHSNKSLYENKQYLLKFYRKEGDFQQYNKHLIAQILKSDLPDEEKQELILYLFDYGYSPNDKDQLGNTLLHIITIDPQLNLKTKQELIRATVKRGGDIYEANDLGELPLFSAIQSFIKPEDKLALTVLYISLGFDLNHRNSEGQSLLHLYSSVEGIPLKTRTKAINTLILHGADASAIDDLGKTPLVLLKESLLSDVDRNVIKESFLYNEELNFRKLLANSFGVSGTTVLRGNQIVLDGLYASQSQSFVAQRIKGFYQELKEELTSDQIDLWEQVLQKLSPEAKKIVLRLTDDKKSSLLEVFDKIVDTQMQSLRYIHQPAKLTAERIQKGELLAMKVIGANHLYGVVCYKGNLYMCNKGRRNTSSPGIYSYQINNKDFLETIVRNFTDNRAFEEAIQSQYYGFTGKNSQLQIQLGSGAAQQVLRQKNQKSGNCAIASSNSMELLMLYLLIREISGLPAEELARAIKSVHVKNRRLSYMKEYLEWHQKEGKDYPVDVDLLIKISNKKTSNPDLDLKLKELLIDWGTSSDQDINISVQIAEQMR